MARRKGIEHQIDNWNMVEKTVNRRTRTLSLHWISGVAAAIALIFSATVFVNNRTNEQEYTVQKDTYDNPKDAYAQTQRALKLFSAKMNKGLTQMNYKKHQKKNKK